MNPVALVQLDRVYEIHVADQKRGSLVPLGTLDEYFNVIHCSFRTPFTFSFSMTAIQGKICLLDYNKMHECLWSRAFSY